MIDNDFIKKIEQRESNPFEQYIDNDLALITILLLIEFAKEDRKVVLFSEFTKFLSDKGRADSDKFEGLSDYMYQSEFIMYIIGELDFVKVDRVYFDKNSCLTNLLKYLVKEANGFSNYDQQSFIESFSCEVRHYLKIEQDALVLKYKFDRFKDYDIEDFEDCFEVEFDKIKNNSLNELLDYAGESIALSFSFDKNKVSTFEKALNSYFVKGFKQFYGQDDEIFIEEVLPDFKFINGAVRIPLELFNGEDFDIVTILKYLEASKQIFVSSWMGSVRFWEVKLLNKDLLSVFVPNPELFLKSNNAERVNASLNLSTKTFTINDEPIELKKAFAQYDLIRILFEEKPIDFDLSFSEIAERIDHSYESLGKEEQLKLNKRYSNASFQLSRKIGFETGIKDLFIMTKNEIRFNPKYKFKFVFK